MSQGLKIDGVVYDQQLNCLPSVNVEIVNGDDQQIASTLTGADGTFYFQQSAKQCDGLYLKVTVSNNRLQTHSLALSTTVVLLSSPLQ